MTGFLGIAERRPSGRRLPVAVDQLGVLVTCLLAVGVWTAILIFIIVETVGALVGLRVSEEVEIEGLDITGRGER